MSVSEVDRATPVAPAVLPWPRRRTSLAATLRAYLALTKPRIIELLLVTTVPPMVVAARGRPSLPLVLATLVGGSMSAGAANSLNCYLDRDIDARMGRTRGRPLVRSGEPRLAPGQALAFGVALFVGSTAWLVGLVNLPAALLAAGAVVYYVGVYTLLLKRRTAENIVIGGAAGAFPVLVGWAAVTGTVGAPAWLLAAVVLLWTPPHFWALAVRFRSDYAAAGVPMLPVVATPRVVGRRIVAYTWATVAASLAVVAVVHTGWLYPAAAAGLGLPFVVEAHRLARRLRAGVPAASMRLFHLSIGYLGLLFAALAVDQVLFR